MLRILGCFDLQWDGHDWPLSSSAQRLVAYLAVQHRDRPAHRTVLAERLWCDLDPQRAAASLRSVLHRLPRLPGRSLVVSTPSAVQLSSHVAVDLWHGEEQAGRTETRPYLPNLEDIGALTADLLPAWDEEWLTAQRESYRQTRLHALEAMSSALLAAERYSAALRAGLAAVQCDPLRESAHCRVMEVHLREGNQAEALRAYERFRSTLSEDLGLEPSPVMHRLVDPLLGRPADRRRPAVAAAGGTR